MIQRVLAVLVRIAGEGIAKHGTVSLYTVTGYIGVACDAICNFYQVYHSSRYVGELFVMRLNDELSDGQVEQLNEQFTGILPVEKLSLKVRK